jgi:dCTP diphosphatase
LSAEPAPGDPPARDLAELRERVLRFVAERDWDQFHSPKNLAMALAVEVAELVEVFQWLTEDESRRLDAAGKAAAADEVADVFIYLLQLSHRLGIDPVSAASAKLVKNGRKYPVDKSRGNNKKYTEL